MPNNVQVKVSGDKKAVEQFLSIVEAQFKLMIKSKLLSNRNDEGVHCFVDLDPFAVKGDTHG